MSDEIPLYDPLDSEPEPEPEPIEQSPESRGGVSPLVIAGALIALLVLVAGAWWVFLRPPSDDEPQEPAAVASQPPPSATAPEPAAPGDDPSAEPAPPPPPLPPLDASDPRVRDEVSRLSTRGEWADWLAPEDLVRRFVASVANVAAGESPRAHLQHMAPEASFQVVEVGERVSVDSASYRRYDLAAEVFASLDIGATVALYHDLEPLFEEAYAEIGDPRQSFRDTLGMAIDRLLAVEVPADDVALVRHATHYKFADPELEALSPAAKHLVRMGPSNADKVQQKLRFLRSALDL